MSSGAAWVFWLSIAWLFYTYAGFPVGLALLARWRPRPAQARADLAPSVCIVVVGYNEAARIGAKIESCLAQTYWHRAPARILIASDGSTDDMGMVVRGYADRGVSFMHFPARRGKAACLNDAAEACREELIVFTDARQRLHPEAVARLVAALGDTRFGAVSGELVFEKDDASSFGEGVDAYWRYEKFIRKQEALVGSAVGVTGALYAIRRDCFRPIPPNTILDDVAIPMQVVMQGRRVGFEAGAIAYDRPSAGPAQERIRKVRTLAGNFQLLQLYPSLLLPWRNPLFLAFFSHKITRLLAPVAMASCLAGNLVLATSSAGYAVLAAVHLAAYGLALAGGRPTFGKRVALARIGHAFVMLNVFVVLGFLQFMRSGESHLWQASEHAGGRDRRR